MAPLQRLDRLTWVLLGVVLAPMVVSALALVVAGDYRPAGDLALIELRTRDLGTHAVLVGPYSRDGWHHLGPSLYYALVGPYRLLLGSSLAIPLTALMLNAAAVTGITVLARRYGSAAFGIATLLACAVLLRSFGAEFVRDLWNPSITVLAFGMLLFCAWAMSCGSTTALPTGCVVATFLVHTHVGYIPLAVPLLAWGAGWLLVLAWRAAPTFGRADGAAAGPASVEWRRLARAAAVSAVLVVVLWSAPVVDELINEPGNASRVLAYFRERAELHSVGDGLRVLSAQFGVAPDWVTGRSDVNFFREPSALYDPQLPLLLALVVPAAAIVAWRGMPVARRYLATVAVGVGCGVVAVARTPGVVSAYRLGWTRVLGMAAALVVVWAVIPLVRRRLFGRAAQPLAVVVACALTVVFALAAVVDAVRAEVPEPPLSEAIGELADELHDELPVEGIAVHLAPTDFITASLSAGLLLALERDGVDARIGESSADWGEHRIVDPGAPSVEYRIAADGEIAAAMDNPAWRLVAYSGSVGYDQLTTELARVARAHGITAGQAIPPDQLGDLAPNKDEVFRGVAVFRAAAA